MTHLAITLVVSSYLLVAAAVALFVNAAQKPEPRPPAPVLWICDQCGALARAEPTPQGVLDLQAIRKGHDCIGSAELVGEVEHFLTAQAPPP